MPTPLDPDVDRLLRRRLYLQRYVTSLTGDAREAMADGDAAIVALLAAFATGASAAGLAAFAKRRTSHPEAREALRALKRLMAEQRDAVQALVATEMAELVEREAVVAAGAIGSEPPSMRGVASEPVNGTPAPELIAAGFALYAGRVLSETATAATTAPADMARIVRGRRSQRFRDGLVHWRDARVLGPNLDLIVKGTATNAATRTYRSAGVEEEDYLSTLDLRSCARCRSAEVGGPYRVGEGPMPSLHPACRCVRTPRRRGAVERPYVLDERPVKDIPVDERDGKIGRTRQGMEAFIDRMTHAQRAAWMGPTRADLWRRGEIDDVRDLVAKTNLRPLRLDELPTD